MPWFRRENAKIYFFLRRNRNQNQRLYVHRNLQIIHKINTINGSSRSCHDRFIMLRLGLGRVELQLRVYKEQNAEPMREDLF
jgi:hypothetical protein